MRSYSKKRWSVIAVISILFVILAFSVDGIQRRFIYNDRMIQLTTYFSQLESIVTNRFNRHFRLLTTWNYHLNHQETTGISDFRNYISAEENIWDVEEIYFFNEAGNYITLDGEKGNAALDDEILSKFEYIGTQQIIKYTTSFGDRQDLYILSVKPGEYEGFNYSAMGMGMTVSLMKNRMTIKENGMEDSQNYLTDEYGNLIMCSVPEYKEIDNIVDYLEENSRIRYSQHSGIKEAVGNGSKGVAIVEMDDENYYVTYMPCGNDEKRLICLTPTKTADASIMQMRTMNTIFLLAAFFIVMFTVLLILRYVKVQDMLAVSETANDAKTRFLANMSHDFRTPMNAMAGYLTLMKENADNPEKVIEYGDKAEFAHRNMLDMINSVLDLSKMEEGGDEIKRERFSLNDVLEEVKGSVEEQSRDKEQNLIIDRERVKEDIFIGDRYKLSQILKKILQNSVTYTDNGGEISLVVSPENEPTGSDIELRFEVTDNGIGMSKEFLDQVFEPFMKEERKNATKEQGTGLGLAVTKNMVEMLGGTIQAESVVNAGTIFTVRLTFEIPEKTETQEMEEIEKALKTEVVKTEEAEEELPFKGMRFLAAEDNELNAEILVEILKMKGAELCDVAEDGVQVLEYFNETRSGYYDMILMDIQMPNMDGYSAAKAIRNLAFTGHTDAATIPILAMSANAFKDDIEKTSESGMDAHIAKPIDINLFESTVMALKDRGHVINE
jgi:signal transduction histidine kinase/AmiR/NasT family two-component response regulator